MKKIISFLTVFFFSVMTLAAPQPTQNGGMGAFSKYHKHTILWPKSPQSLTIYPAFQQDWQITGAPESTLVLGQGGTIYQYDRIVDNATGNLYRIIVVGPYNADTQTYTGCEFELIATTSNINSILYPETRSAQRSSPAFNTAYTPSGGVPTFVTASLSMTTTALNSVTLTAQIDTGDGNGYVNEAIVSQGALVDSRTITMTFEVPAGASYKIIDTGSTGTRSIALLKEAQI